MKTPEEIMQGLECCLGNTRNCKSCPYQNESRCMYKNKYDAFKLIQQQKNTITKMKAQMHGDCGVCVHRHEQAETFRKSARRGEFAITDTCAQCIKKETRPNWEYDGQDA